MKKKILSLTLSFTMIASLANVVMAAGENNTIVYSPLEMKYPTADITPEFVEGNFDNSGYCILSPHETGNGNAGEKIPVDSDRVFKVGGKEFLLLDKDAEGNYFIVQKEPLNFSSWLYSGMSNTAGNYTHQPESTAANGWKFDCTADGNSTSLRSIAHYMNDFNTAFKPYIPQTIKDYLIVTDWKTGADSAKDYTGENSEWSQEKRKNNPEYITRGKLGLLSAQEYIAYFDILGYTHKSYLGTALRTPASRVYTSNGETKYSCGPMVVNATGRNVMITYGYAPNTTGVIIQACFWVNNQFFKEVELESAGADVAAEILATMSDSEIDALYTEEERESLGLNKSFVVSHNLADGISELTEVKATAIAVNPELSGNSAFVVLAAYDNDGRMIGCDAETVAKVDGKITSPELKVSDITEGTLKNIKIMVWDSISNMKPVVLFDSDK